jgi:hypothetical protein
MGRSTDGAFVQSMPMTGDAVGWVVGDDVPQPARIASVAASASLLDLMREL